MRTALLVLALAASSPIFSQTGTNSEDPRVFKKWDGGTAPSAVDTPATSTGAPGKVTVHENAKITGLMEEYASNKQDLKGYRVQIFLGDRTKAEDIRRSFLVRHPETPAYLSYLAPNFRVRVGDMRDRVTAEKLRDDLKEEFPGLYVVPDGIELPRLIGAEGK